MSQINADAECSNMEREKREIKLTAKAMENKIERLQHERKSAVNKIKELIPQIKAHMKSKENVTEIPSQLNNLNALCKKATDLHNEVLQLLPDDEHKKQKEWFSSIMDYSDAFKEQVEKWIKENPHENSNELPLQTNTSEQPTKEINYAEQIPVEKSKDLSVADPPVPVSTGQDPQDELQPCDSISNATKKSRSHHSSSLASRSSARLKTETNLAILATKQKALKEKHALDEEELKLRKRREQLLLENEIAEEMAKLSVIKSQSSVGSKSKSKVSDGMNSYYEKTCSKQQLNNNAMEFVPSLPVKLKSNAIETTQTVVKPKVTHLPDIKHLPGPSYMLQRYLTIPEDPVTNVTQTDASQNDSVLDIMRKQNEISTLLMQQQCLSALPKREIPIFDGNPLKYHSFIKAFENGVERNTSNNCDRLYFLEQYTKGHAKGLVRSCQHIESSRGYVKAKALLKEHYGNEQKVAAAYMERALSWPTIKTEDVKALQEYGLFLRGCCNALEDVQYLSDLDTPTNMVEIIKKLPYKLRDRWRCDACDLQERYNRRARFVDIANFVEKQVKILTDPVFGNIQDTVITTKQMKHKPPPRSSIRGTSFATTVNRVERTAQPVKATYIKPPAKKICPCCTGGHTLDVCARLEKMAHKEKIDFLKENGACFRCLCIGHISKNCQRKISCSKCGLRHPTVLHKDSVATAEPAERSIQVTVDDTLVSSGLTGAGEMDCKLPIVPIQVKAKKGNKIILTYAFLDQGSTAVFCTESLKQKLNLSGKRANILLRTMGQEKVVSSYIVPELEVAALEDDSFIELPKAYTQLSMPVHKANIPTNKDLTRWPYLKHISLPQIEAGIELLIGTNVPRAMEPLEVIRSEHNGPYAIRTALGWTVNGPLTGNGGEANYCEQPVTVNRVSIVNLDELWQQQFKMDFPESAVEEQVGLSREDLRFMDMVTKSAKHVNGHYQVALPLKNPNVSMPNNRKVVEQRQNHLKRRLQRDPVFYREYNTFINDLLGKGYAEKVPDAELERSDGRVWYIPHHGVYHPTKGKLRVVFDCGASYKGQSLNEELLQGPDLTSSLIGVVTRFRREPVVIMADIEAMFHQVQVPPDDADLLRFLWWSQGDLNQAPCEYRMKVHLFGATSSPSCANFSLRKCAEDFGHEHKEETVDKLQHCFYVDDCLVAVATEEEALILCHELMSLCAKGGFCLTKWHSNRSEVLKTIPEPRRAKGMEQLDLDREFVPIERVLGVEWCIKSDTFKFKIVWKDRPLNRRGILSTVSSIYDPLGMLSPLVLTAKRILRDLCRRGVGWDDPIPETVSKEWFKWVQGLHLLDNFELPRCLKPLEFGDVITAQLHHFCDASEEGYGTVTYLLLQNEHLQMHSAFIMGKARVAPLKTVTIPRMELIAATMASRMDVLWKKELHMSLQESVFWTDSASVLKYINNESSRFKVFVANRVSEILKSSHPAQWRYVDTASNPADAASRGLKVEAFLKDRLWLTGPPFLCQPETEWPVNPEPVSHLPQDDPEVKKTAVVNAVQAEEDPTTHLIHHYSSWIRLKKAVAWWLKYKEWLSSCIRKRKRLIANQSEESMQQQRMMEQERCTFKGAAVLGAPTVEDIDKAELAIIQFCQKRKFFEELSCLEKGQNVKKNSHLHKLCPRLEDGVLRVGGRLSKAALPLESKHPIILAKDLHISTLLLRNIHQEVGHSGRNHMLSKLREKYWMTGASTAIRRVLSKCTICRRLNATPVCQQMADLPTDRLKPDEPPFTCVGVDYFGPIEVRSRRSTVKRYGVLFTCLVLRAIHIEVAPSLDTDSFINALRRFIARRGQVRELRSDNGTNFVGAERELKTTIAQWNQAQVYDVLLQKGIKWTFNPPAGSHHGGVWERLIRSVRKVLNSTLKVQRLDEEGLHTVLCEVEAIINSRPITKASTDPNDLEALTPNHLLLLKNQPSLPPGEFQAADLYAQRRWRQVQYISDLFWKRWTKEYLPLLQERQRWTGVQRNLVAGDLVLLMDSTAPRNSWIMGRVLQTFPDRKGFVRQIRIKTRTSCLDRPISKVCLLLEKEEAA